MLHLTVTRSEPEVARVVLSGRLRVDGAVALQRLLVGLGWEHVVLDLTDIGEVDADGLEALEAAAADLAADGVVVDLRTAC